MEKRGSGEQSVVLTYFIAIHMSLDFEGGGKEVEKAMQSCMLKKRDGPMGVIEIL